MKKEYHIKKSTEIEEIIKKRQTVGNKYFIIYKNENSETSHFRFAVSVGKKIGNAVVRNYEKRKIRNVFQELKDSIITIDLFVVEKPDALTLSYAEMKHKLEVLLHRHGVIRSEET